MLDQLMNMFHRPGEQLQDLANVLDGKDYLNGSSLL